MVTKQKYSNSDNPKKKLKFLQNYKMLDKVKNLSFWPSLYNTFSIICSFVSQNALIFSKTMNLPFTAAYDKILICLTGF